ncbi:MAG TPA: hypothetical protein ENN19_09545 [Chloroflexi bacterium]|nr:hypothetical protein [Chloroflexota bacterium]
MKRKALLKDGDKFVVLEESDFEAETALQEALKRNPEVVPVADLELGQVVVVGRETSVLAGAIDLLLVDAEGQVIIVETKLSRNPELRRQVLVQVLDYGASLWRTAPTLKQFEELVLRYWRSDACEDERVKGVTSLREGLPAIFQELCGEDWDYDTFEAALEGNLANGQHVLLVVASGLMDGLSRDLLQYANICLNIPLYGVEIDVFETAARQLIVPRGVRYTPRVRQRQQSTGHTDRNAFLAACTPLAATFFERVLDEAEARGLVVYWGSLGFSVRVPLDSPVTVMYGYPSNDFIVYTGQMSMNSEDREVFHRVLKEIAPTRLGGSYSNHIYLNEDSEKQAYAALAFVWEEVERLLAGHHQNIDPNQPQA